jgi:hypothetical protein
MALALHEVSILPLIRGLGRLSHLLSRAQQHVLDTNADESALLQARLADDMLPLLAQVQRASDTAKFSGQRLSGIAGPAMPDTEQTMQQLIARLGATVDYLRTLTPAALDANEAASITLKAGSGQVMMDTHEYLTAFALPNLYFHVAIAHGILRQQGVPVGKLDYLGPMGTPT